MPKAGKTVEIAGKEEKLNAEVCDRAAVRIKESSNGGVGKKTADNRKRISAAVSGNEAECRSQRKNGDRGKRAIRNRKVGKTLKESSQKKLPVNAKGYRQQQMKG